MLRVYVVTWRKCCQVLNDMTVYTLLNEFRPILLVCEEDPVLLSMIFPWVLFLKLTVLNGA
jgi:hypothetical protein